jgi:N-acetylglutamate synthase-like GNAT family acetyltransferase
MYRTERERLRSLMGQSLSGWASQPGAVGEIGDGYWLVLSGAPSPDVNVALVWTADPQALRRSLDLIDQVGAPTLINLTGDGNVQKMPDGWEQVGTMPFMAVDLDATPTEADSRVRPATGHDLGTVVDLLAESFALPAEIAVVPVKSVVQNAGSDARMAFWLLEDDGVAVSTVMTAQVEDIVSVWCMATPERFARRSYARALLAHVLHVAAGQGATFGLLAATPAGKPLYDATGWSTLEEWRLHLNSGSA